MSFFASLKMYFYLAAIAAILGGVYWFNSVLDERTELRAAKKENLQTISNMTAAKEDVLLQAIKDNTWSIKYQSEQDTIKNETKILRAVIAANPSIVYVHAACKPVPSTESNTSGTTEAHAELTQDARQGYIDLTEQIKEVQLLNVALVRRVSEDYEKCGSRLEAK